MTTNPVFKSVPKQDVDAIYDALIDDDSSLYFSITSNYESHDLILPPSSKKISDMLRNEPSILMCAAFFGAEDIFSQLKGLIPSPVVDHDSRYRNVLFYAAAGGNITIFRDLDDTTNYVDNDGNTPMYYALLNGNIDIVRYLWSKGISFINSENQNTFVKPQTNHWGYRQQVTFEPFDVACKSGNLELVKFISANIERFGPYIYKNRGCILSAIKSYNVEIVKFLVESGADINDNDYMYEAAKRGMFSTVKLLYDSIKKAGIVMYPLKAFFAAAENGYADILKYFNENGLRAKLKGTIIAAIKNRHMPVIRYAITHTSVFILSKNLERMWLDILEEAIDAPGIIFKTIFEEANLNIEEISNALITEVFQHNNPEVMDYIIEKGVKIDGLQFDAIENPIMHNYVESLKIFLEKTEFVKMFDSYDKPLILMPVKYNSPEILKTIIDQGGIINSDIIKNFKILDIAAKQPNEEMFNILLEYVDESFDSNFAITIMENSTKMDNIIKRINDIGIRFDGNTETAKNAGTKAIESHNPVYVENVLSMGGTFNDSKPEIIKLGTLEKNMQIKRPVFFTSSYTKDHLKCLEMLFNEGYDPGTVDSYKENLLHSLMRSSGKVSEESIDFLLKFGVDINAQAKDGRTPLDLCLLNSKANLVPFLLQRGANPNILDADNNTALHFAAKIPNQLYYMSVLIDYGANINALSKHNETPLSLVMRKENGVSPSWTERETNTQIEAVNKRSVCNIALFLLDNGANINKYPGGASICQKRAVELENDDLIDRINKIIEEGECII